MTGGCGDDCGSCGGDDEEALSNKPQSHYKSSHKVIYMVCGLEQ